MHQPGLETEVGRWQPAGGSGPTVEYSKVVMEELRMAATEALHKVPRGGVETGGVLYGIATQSSVRVTAWRPIPCEHARGPAFLLSEKDEVALTALIRPEGALRAVGWFVSHGRGELRMTDEDVRISGRYFPKAWQVMIVLKPARFLPVRASFFVREQGRDWSNASDPDEFLLEPMQRRREPPVGQPPPPPPVSPEVEPPKFLPAAPPARPSMRKRRLAAVAGTAVLAWGLHWAWLHRASLRLPVIMPPHVALALSDAAGQLRIEWDRRSPAVIHSDGATVEIVEPGSGARTVVELTGDQLRVGSITYARRGEDVRVRLTVRHTGLRSLELAQFVGPPVVPKSAELEALLRENRNLEEQVRKLRRQTRDEQVRTRTLEDGIAALEKRIR